MPRVSIFAYRDYRAFLADFFEQHIKAKGLSYRSVSKRGNIANPSYLQQVISRQRNASKDSAQKIARGLGLNKGETKFFLALVNFEHDVKTGKLEQGLEQLRTTALEAKVESRHDESIYASWLHGVVWALVGIRDFKLTLKSVSAYLRGIASPDEIAKSIAFVKEQDLVEPTPEPDTFVQKPLRFTPVNDVRRIEIQRNHVRFLDLAKLRILDPIDDREYQGMTISVSKARLPFVKQEIRVFMSGLHERLSHDPDANAVLRVQCAAYWITRDPQDDLSGKVPTAGDDED